MKLMNSLVVCALVAATDAGAGAPAPSGSPLPLKEFQARAVKFNSLITIPRFETSPEELQVSVRGAITEGNAALDRIGRLAGSEITFTNTARALDDMAYAAMSLANRLALIKETSPNAALRDKATEALKELEAWDVGVDYREDVYRVLQAYASKQPKLKGEDAKLLEETMRDYRRAGLQLPKAERGEVEHLRKELARLAMDFESNINRARKELKFTRADLAGVPESFLEQTKTGADEYTVKANVTWHYQTVLENARSDATRKRMLFERENLARQDNVPLLEKIIPLRDTLAKKLGYKTWADFQTEVKMVKDARTAIAFLEDLKHGLQPKFEAEIAEFQKIKARETGDPKARVEVWDWRYLANQLQKERYTVDAEQLRVYFPYQRVLDGMFAIYQRIFGLRFEPVAAPYKWVEDLQLYGVSDAATGEPLGLFFLDMFPRDGKYNHFAQFGILEGKLLPSGKYQRPTVALVCNFPAPALDRPSLLSHGDVETLFHEFGHAMHSILTRARYSRFAGTSVPRDFVEAPSQMLEAWVWDKAVLDSFAADYRDPSKKIPDEILGRLKEARLAVEGTRYRRQIAFGLTDLRLHTQIHAGNASEIVPLSNKILSDTFFPVMPGTAFVAYFGHLMGYDAGYYGYAWADAIAADLATVFERAPGRYFDTRAGQRLRQEIYEPGDSRDVNVSVKKFLGRKPSREPFLRKIGIGKNH